MPALRWRLWTYERDHLVLGAEQKNARAGQQPPALAKSAENRLDSDQKSETQGIFIDAGIVIGAELFPSGSDPDFWRDEGIPTDKKSFTFRAFIISRIDSEARS